MRTRFVTGMVVGAIVGGLAVASSAAFAGTGIGSPFNLGSTNRVNASTVLRGSTNGQQLRVTNASSHPGAAGVGIHTDPRNPPLTVNSKAKVTNLNADLLDGKDSDALQQRVTGTCTGGTAISRIGATGSVSSAMSAQIPVRTVLDNGDFVNDLLTPSLDLQLNCGDIAGFDGLEFISRSDADASLNWMFSEGGATSTVNTNGQTVAPGNFVAFSLSGARLEGQFIWADTHHVVTVSISVVDDPASCAFSGTALVNTTP